MANLQERRDKDGKLISYSIRIYRGRSQDGKQLKPFTATFEVKPTWSEKSARKKAEAYAATLEDRVRNGLVSDNRQRFDEYCEYVLEQKARTGTKKTSIKGYRAMTKRIYAAIGHILLKDIRPDHLNRFYAQLEEDGSGIEKRTACSRKLTDLLKEKKMTRKSLSEGAGVPINTVYSAVKGNPVPAKTAIALSKELGMDVNEVFDTQKKLHTLSANTVQHYHRLISMVLEQAVKEGLESKSYAVDWFQDGNTALYAPEDVDYDCILLDLGLPGLDGMSLLGKWRAQKIKSPVIVLTARDAIADRVSGLDKGADDYLVKPFDFTELLARIRAVLRRSTGNSEKIDNLLTNGVLTLDPVEHLLTVKEENESREVSLTSREFSLLEALMQRPGAVLSREALEQRIYSYDEEVESNAVEFIIHSLRKKIGASHIKNVRGVGWKVAKEA